MSDFVLQLAEAEDFIESVHEPIPFQVTMLDRQGRRSTRVVLAEGERLALGTLEKMIRGSRAVAVNDVPVIGRCVRCRGWILEGDWRQQTRVGLVCESCPRGVAVQLASDQFSSDLDEPARDRIGRTVSRRIVAGRLSVAAVVTASFVSTRIAAVTPVETGSLGS